MWVRENFDGWHAWDKSGLSGSYHSSDLSGLVHSFVWFCSTKQTRQTK